MPLIPEIIINSEREIKQMWTGWNFLSPVFVYFFLAVLGILKPCVWVGYNFELTENK